MRRLLALFFGCASVLVAQAAEPTSVPQRIDSINLCVDALLLKLVEPARIDSIYYLSASPQFSPFAHEAAQFNLNHGLAEELAPRKPDLIIAGEFNSADTKTLLKRLGFRLETLSLPRTLADISEHIRQFGRLTGSQVAAEKMAVNVEQQLAHLDEEKNKHAPIPAFWYASNGVVVGSDTLENELMSRAGFYNLALEKHINGFAQLDLETLILAQPKVLIIEASDVQAFSMAHEYIQHPALRKNNIKIVTLPATMSVCIAPIAAEVIENLIEQKNKIATDH